MAFSFPRIQLAPIKRFLYTYKEILSIAYKVSPRFLIIATLSNSLWGLTNLPILYINKLLIDVVVGNLGKTDLVEPLQTITALIIFRAFIEFIRSYLSRLNWTLSTTLTDRIQAYLELKYGERLSELSIPLIESPEFQDRFKKIEREARQRFWGMIGPLSDVPNALFTLISGIIPILTFNPLLLIAVVVVSIPDIISSSTVAKKDFAAMELLNPKWRLWGWISHHLTNSESFYENRILGGTKYLIERLSKVQNEVNQSQFNRRLNRLKLRTLSSIPNYILSFVLNVYFFSLALIGKITLGSAQLLYGATNTFTSGLATLVNDGVTIYENYLFMADLTWFLDLKPDEGAGGTELEGELGKEIEFKNVWFKYPNSKRWILKGVNFCAKANEHLALVGENGAGKTTLIKLLCGFYKPTKGEILVDGVNLSEVNKEKFRRLLGVLFQDFSHYPFSAKESIGVGRVARINDLAKIKAASKLTGVNDFIESLPLGYNTPLAKEFDKGIDPSRGQWQRIALARILFRNSPIIILDEPTSNVDPKAEQEIFDKIMQLAKDKILILISHRFSTVRKADRILNLDKGRIVEQGTHEELMKRNGEYADLFRLQAKGYQ